MASTSETGHAKNVDNFEILKSYCTGYGVKYAPTKATITLLALDTKLTDSQASLVNVTSVGTIFTNKTNDRQIVFAPTKPLATRIVAAFAATDASTEAIADAKTINRKIQGKRKSDNTPPPPPPPDGTPPPDDNSISVSQQSYNALSENFKKLVDLVGSEPSYAPNEDDLKIVNLAALTVDMAAKNTAVINATTDLSNARIERNKILYKPKEGLYDVAQDVKKYVKSVFGATSPEFKQVSKIQFTDRKS